MEELAYTIEQNKTFIEREIAKIEEQSAKLRELTATDNWHGYSAQMWTEGHVSEIVTNIAGLMMRQRALVDVQFMLQKQETEG